MGQYFMFVNLDKKEYVVPDTPLKLCEICFNPKATILVYLLATENKDGTILLTSVSSEGDKNKLEMRGWKVITYYQDINTWVLEKETKYYGRWCGDRIVVAGDYDQQGVYDLAKRNFKDITKDAYEEFYSVFKYDPKQDEFIHPDLLLW